MACISLCQTSIMRNVHPWNYKIYLCETSCLRKFPLYSFRRFVKKTFKIIILHLYFKIFNNVWPVCSSLTGISLKYLSRIGCMLMFLINYKISFDRNQKYKLVTHAKLTFVWSIFVKFGIFWTNLFNEIDFKRINYK